MKKGFRVPICDIHKDTESLSCLECELDFLHAQLAEAQEFVQSATGAWNTLQNISDTLRSVGISADQGAVDERVIILKNNLAEAQKKAEALDKIEALDVWEVVVRRRHEEEFQVYSQENIDTVKVASGYHSNLIDAINEAWEKVKS